MGLSGYTYAFKSSFQIDTGCNKVYETITKKNEKCSLLQLVRNSSVQICLNSGYTYLALEVLTFGKLQFNQGVQKVYANICKQANSRRDFIL